jgi:hypothetical protein
MNAGLGSARHARTSESGSITVTSPAAGSEWISGRSYSINWTWSGAIALVTIDLFYQSSWNLAIASAIQNTGEYLWTVPAATQLGYGCQVRVSDANDASVSSTSDTFAIIDKYISISSPSSSDVWQAATQAHICWTGVWVVSVNIELYRSGSNFSTIAQSYGWWSQDYWWTVPQHIETGSDYQIKVSSADDPLVYDFSDFFTISSPPWIEVISPDCNSSWEAGTIHDVLWDSSQIGDSVRIDLLNYGGFCERIAESTPNDGSFEWKLSAYLSQSSGYQLQIIDVSGTSSASCTSDYFAILAATCPWIHVTTPSGSDIWYSGNSYYLYWSSSDVSQVTIQLYVEGACVSTICTSTSGWYFYWTPDWFQPTSSRCQIKITDLADGSVFDFSDNFTIAPTPRIRVSYPTADTSWEQGTTHVITWDSYEAGDYVRIDLLSYGQLSRTIASNTSNDGAADWDIPVDICPWNVLDAFQIRVSSLSNTSLYGDSPWYFELRPSTKPFLIVSDPTSGDTTLAGGECDIYVWGRNNPGALAELELHRDGVLCSTISRSAAVSSTFYWFVPIGQQPGTGYQVKAISLTYDDVSAYSSTFEILPRERKLVVTQPSSGQTVVPGSNLTIRWYTVSHETSSVDIELWAGGSPVLVIKADAFNSGEYRWPVPSSLAPGYYQVNVSSNSDSGVFGNGFFTVLTVSGELLAVNSFNDVCGVNSTVEIRWTSAGIGPFVSIELYSNWPMTFLDEIASNTSNDGSYQWLVPPGAYPDWCMVKITSLDRPWVSGTASVTIRSSWLSISAPTEGDTLEPGSTIHVVWTSNDAGSAVCIELWCDDGLVATLVSNTPNDGSFEWMVPADLIPSYSYELMVKSVGGLTDSEDYVYRLHIPEALPSYILVTSPNGGESWSSGTIHSINWTMLGGNGQVRIELYASSSQVLTIAASTPDDGTYAWTVPANMVSGTDFRVKITSPADARVFDFSDGPFEIEGALAAQVIVVTSPENGGVWTVGTAHLVSWTWTGDLGCVKIELVKGGEVVLALCTNASCDGSFEWVVNASAQAGVGYQVKVTSMVDSSVSSTSVGTFSIEAKELNAEATSNSLPIAISIASLALAAITIVAAMVMVRRKS